MLQTINHGGDKLFVRKSNSKSSSDLFTAEFEINEIRPAARTILTKGPTQDEISNISGASISTRGRFISATEKRSGNQDRPLYLFVQGITKESVDLAVQRIEEIIKMDRGPNKYNVPNNSSCSSLMPQMTKPPPPVMSAAMPVTNTTNTMGTHSSTCIEKIFIGLDHAPLAFDLRSRLIGSGGANLNYIRTETGAMATLRGRGSLFVDPMMGIESPEPIHLYIEHLRYEGLQAAKQLARNLIETLQTELCTFQQVTTPPLIQYSSQTTALQQPQIYTHHTMAQQPPMLQPGGSIVTHTLPPTYLQQPPPPTSQSSQPVMQTHSMPMQLHPGAAGLVQIQQQTIATGTTISLPPPPGHPPHLSQPPPSLQQLQQQQQLPPPGQTQIVMNQPLQAPPPQANYQYQYIHTGADAASVAQQAATPLNPGQVTIQHIYQAAPPPPQPQSMHSIMHPVNGSNTAYSDVTTTTFAQHLIRPPQQMQQQFITVQGNTAYMVPPPNMIQTTTHNPHQQHQPATSHTIIFSTQPPPQMLQQPPNYSMAQLMQAVTSREMSTMVAASNHQIIAVQQQQQLAQQGGPPTGIMHDEVKLEEKPGGESGEDFNEGQHNAVTLEGMVQHQRAIMTAPPPIMSVPPPPTIQHIMGNSYVANPVFAQAPVSASQQQQQQTIHMLPPASSVAPVQPHPHQQQQFVINPHGWPQHSMAGQTVVSTQQPPPMQPVGHNVHMGHYPQQYRPGSGGTTYQQIQHPIMTAAAYNNSPLGGISVQYQSVPPPPPPPTSLAMHQQQQPGRHLMAQSMGGAMQMENAAQRGLITTTAVLQQPPPLPQSVLTTTHQFKTGPPQQQQLVDGGGPGGVMTIKHQMPPPPYSTGGPGNNTVMQVGGPPPPQPVPFPMQAQMENAAAAAQLMRTGQKRKILEEDGEKGNLNGNGDRQQHRRMVHEAFSQDAGQVPTSSCGGGGRATSVGHGLSNTGSSNTNSNDLTQDNYATTGHCSDELHKHATMIPMGNPDDPQQQQLESHEEGNHQYQTQHTHDHGEIPQMTENGMLVPRSHASSIAVGADPMGSVNGHISQMAMIRCNVMEKPPPYSVATVANNSQPPPPPRYTNQW